MKQLTPEQIALIKTPLPVEAITQHPTKTYLSSIKAIYVTERLNNVFWIWAWTIKTQAVSINDKWMAVVLVTFEIPEYWFYYESFGWNDNWWSNNKNFDLWDAYKWATTDAITKIASWIWIWADVFKGLQKWWSTPKTNTTENSKPKEEVKWYNDVDKNIDKWVDMIADWTTTPKAIIDKIEAQGFKLSAKNKEQIMNLS